MTDQTGPEHGQPPTGAVIIPAHNEENVIGRTLSRLAPFSRGERGQVDVLVVCNGCTDATADVARRFTGVTVIEIAAASKPTAMNIGDAATARWPRLYLDADIEIEPSAVEAVFHELSRDGGCLAARADATENVKDAALLVRAYFRARSRIPEQGTRLWGAGGYAVSERGHERFSSFPEVTNDDSYFDSLFAEEEKVVLPTAPMLIQVPRSTLALLRVLTRHRRGQLELSMQQASHPGRRARALVTSVRGVPSALDAFCYAALTEIARLRSRGAAGRGTSAWETDSTTRPLDDTERGKVNAA